MDKVKKGGTITCISTHDIKESLDFPPVVQLQGKSNKTKHKRWYHDVADFANLLKSFVGTNYLSLAYGVSLAGLGLGIAGLVVIGILTAHCCHLIVKVKYHVIQRILEKRRPLVASGSDPHSTAEEEAMYKHLQRSMTYPDVGHLVFGNWGGWVVQFFLVVTQVGFCVNYHIFIGSNLYSMISPVNETSGSCTNYSSLPIINNTLLHQQHLENINLLDFASAANNYGSATFGDIKYISASMEVSTMQIPGHNTTSPPTSSNTRWLPPLVLLIVSPLPLFTLFVLFRNVRVMGFVSLLANGMLTAGYFALVGYVIATFELANDLKWFKWATFPVFLGQASSSYEAIGTLLSIEASMEGNHHRFPICLYTVIILFSVMLSVSAIIGYLRYGNTTAQILVQNLPQTGAVILTVNAALITAVVLTYPLQVYPVLETLEAAIFTEGACCGPRRERARLDSKNSEDALVTDETQPLLDSSDGKDVEKSQGVHVVKVIPQSVPTWKRNLFRVLIAVLIAGLAMIFRNVFAYVNAFVGAVGSCPLAFVLPCLFHLKICWGRLSRGVIIKDICIMVFGIVIGMISLIVVLQEIIGKMNTDERPASNCT